MPQEPPKKTDHPKKKRTHEKAVSLYGMSFDAAVAKLAKAKPPKKHTKN